MPIIIPKDLPAYERLTSEKIFVMDEGDDEPETGEKREDPPSPQPLEGDQKEQSVSSQEKTADGHAGSEIDGSRKAVKQFQNQASR